MLSWTWSKGVSWVEYEWEWISWKTWRHLNKSILMSEKQLHGFGVAAFLVKSNYEIRLKLHRRKTETEDVVHTQERDREEREKTDMKSRNNLWTHMSVCVCPTIGHNLLVSKSCVLHVRINIQYLSFCIMLFHRMLSSIHFSVMMHLILPYGWVNLSSGWAFRELNCAHIRGFLILLTLCLFCNSAAVNRKTTHLSACTCVSGA